MPRPFHLAVAVSDLEAARQRLVEAGVEFIIDPAIRFKGEVGEQATMFFRDPSGNHLEIKAFERLDQLFARQ